MSSRGYHVNRHARRHCNSSNINVHSRKTPPVVSRSEAGGNAGNSSSYLADDENYPSFKAQLAKLGLELRDIPADGNCLFSALADQLDGSSIEHEMHRRSVCEYIVKHRSDFEPFIEDDVPFDAHIRNLRQLGTYGGNEVIVAFCRLHRVNVVIHQLGRDPWQICGTEEARTEDGAHKRRQLHIAYHNGDHYSSVRQIGDASESPSSIRIPFDVTNAHNAAVGGYGRFLGSGHGGASRGKYRSELDEEISRIYQRMGGYFTREEVLKAHEDAGYDEDSTMSYLLQLRETDLSDEESPSDAHAGHMSSYASNNSNNAGLWSPNGTGSRIFGGPAASSVAARPAGKPVLARGRQAKQNSKQAKKERAVERRRLARLDMPGAGGQVSNGRHARGVMQDDEYIIQGVHAVQI